MAYPPNVNGEILSRFGPGPRKGGAKDPHDAPVNWTEEVLREYIIPQLQPDVVLNWLGERRSDDRFLRAAAAIEEALDRAIANPQWRTRDLGGSLGTKAFAARVAALVSESAGAR